MAAMEEEEAPAAEAQAAAEVEEAGTASGSSVSADPRPQAEAEEAGTTTTTISSVIADPRPQAAEAQSHSEEEDEDKGKVREEKVEDKEAEGDKAGTDTDAARQIPGGHQLQQHRAAPPPPPVQAPAPSPPRFQPATFPAEEKQHQQQQQAPARRSPSGGGDTTPLLDLLQGELRTHWRSTRNSMHRAVQSAMRAASEAYEDGADGGWRGCAGWAAARARAAGERAWSAARDRDWWARKSEEWQGEVLDRAEYAWEWAWEEGEAWAGRVRDEGVSPLYLFSASLLIVVLLFTGLGKFSSSSSRGKSWRSLDGGSISSSADAPAPRVLLPDGRYIAYREEGVAAAEARHHVLVVHGFMSSRLAGIPGIEPALLEEFGVRLVSYDRPGYGQSDPHPGRTLNSSAQDMVYMADTLRMGVKFWVLGYSGGGPHAWAALHYIPHRLAGVAMLAPMGHPYAGNMSAAERDAAWSAWPWTIRALFILSRRAPFLLRGFLDRAFIRRPDQLAKSFGETLGAKDRALIAHPKFSSLWVQDMRESVRQGGAAHAEEVALHVRDWGFALSDLFRRSARRPGLWQRWFGKARDDDEVVSLPVHIWQGTDDRLVPAAMNEFAKRMVPDVHLHRLDSEGHLSFFCFCEPCHRLILKTLFGEPIGPIARAAKLPDKADAVA